MAKITEEPDGTFTIEADDFLDLDKPLGGVQSLKLANEILNALYEAERAGARNYAESEF